MKRALIGLFLLISIISVAQTGTRCAVCPPSLSGVTNGSVLTDSSGRAMWKSPTSGIKSGNGTTVNGDSIDLGGALNKFTHILGDGNDLLITSDQAGLVGLVVAGDSSLVGLTKGDAFLSVIDTSITCKILDRFIILDTSAGKPYLFDIHTGIPSVSVGAGAGTGATTTVSNSSDVSGEITLNTGTLPSTASVAVTLTYAHQYTRAAHVVIFPANALTALLSGTSMVFVTNATTNFKITSGAVALTASSTYKWSYIVMQ